MHDVLYQGHRPRPSRYLTLYHLTVYQGPGLAPLTRPPVSPLLAFQLHQNHTVFLFLGPNWAGMVAELLR